MNVLKQVLLKIWEGQSLTGDDFIALGLLLGMVVSLSHLSTMLATRWGDRHIAVKSLLASLLVHSVCLLGLEVFEPLSFAESTPETARAVVKESTTRILVESTDTVALRESGNTPLPDRATPPDIDLNRLPQDARLMAEPEIPDREQEFLDSLQPTAEDVSQFEPAEAPEVAIRNDAGAEGPRVAAANDVAADVQTLLEQSFADVYVPNPRRVQTERGDVLSTEPTPEKMLSEGSVNRINTNIVTEDTSVAMATSSSPSRIALPKDGDTEAIDRKAAPLTSSADLEIAGLTTEASRSLMSAAESFQSRLQRPSRTISNRDPGDRPVRQNSLTPQAAIPLASNYDEVRDGQTSVNITDALRSAATLIDADNQNIRRRESRPATYQLRSVEQRRDATRRFGGTVQSEAAVELSLQWLSNMQSADGHWDAETYGAGQVDVDENGVKRNFAGRDADTGLSALVTLSFLGAGYTHEEGKYAINVDRALDWILSQQDSEGSLAGNAEHYARMYCHAMATYALAEAIGMQDGMVLGPLVDPHDIAIGALTAQTISSQIMMQHGLMPGGIAAAVNAAVTTNAEFTGYGLRKVDDIRLRAALLRAITYTISQQNPKSGGWRYKFGQEGDVSMFGWQMMSLKSAAIAGVRIDPTVRTRMIRFLNSVRQGKDGGLFGYRRSVILNGQRTEPVNPTMTAEALFCQQMLGYPRESPASEEAVRYMLANLPRLSELNMYYWYYGTLAMYQFGGKPWEQWNSVVRDTLIGEQRQDGQFAGSWDPTGPWGPYGGRLYSTALSTLTLEVYYRLLPLYRMNESDTNR